mgnify:FL=1
MAIESTQKAKLTLRAQDLTLTTDVTNDYYLTVKLQKCLSLTDIAREVAALSTRQEDAEEVERIVRRAMQVMNWFLSSGYSVSTPLGYLRPTGEAYSSGAASADRYEAGTGTADDALLVWHEYSFTMPADVPEMNVPYHLYMEHSGNGFIYLNGHCLGRCWEAGPQNSYYLPECWLNRGGTNRIVVSMRPVDGEADIRKAVVVPAIWATMRETNKD